MENFIIANCTDVGKARSINEDSMVTFDTPKNGCVVVVCDGMGGQNAGDVASQLAVSAIQDILTDNAFSTPEEAIRGSIIAANQAILRKAAKEPSLIGMGATCVMAIIKDNKLYYGSVGDSRIYYIADGMIRQITKDQSYVQTLVDAGEITQEEAEHHANKNEITNALGVETMTAPVICQMPITPEPGSVCLLCSDGLTGMVNNNNILQTVMRKDKSLQERAELLVRQANDAGGHDNITVQLVEWSDKGKTSKKNSTSTAVRKSNALLYIIAFLFVAVVCGGAAYWFFLKSDVTPVVQQEVIQKKKKVKKAEDVKTTTVIKEVVKETPTKQKGDKRDGTIFNKVNKKAKKNASQKKTGKAITGKEGKPKAESVPEVKYGNYSDDKNP